MGFTVFLWNTFARMFSLAWFIILEIFIFSIIYDSVAESSPVFAKLLGTVFFIWIVVEILLRLIVGTGANLFKYIFTRFIK